MKSRVIFVRFAVIAVFGLSCRAAPAHAVEPTKTEALAAMRAAAAFMADSVSTHGGYVYQYTADLTDRWGEIPARPTQIWTQPPGTPTVGMMLLDAFRATGDSLFLDCAERAADALVWGQHPAGGWHYLVDFDMPG
ncbi:MAG: pectate lyase, partial [Candidatus Latescibacteria bacterium]|nr:pectate lyase [Candidatus Latescibacterota bacterium]